MTLKRITELYHLKQEVKEVETQLKELEERANSPSSPNWSGMPSAHNGGSAVESYAVAIADKHKILAERYVRIAEEEVKLEAYISRIDSSYLRRAFELRFREGKSWVQVGVAMNLPPDTVRIAVYRYLDKGEVYETDV